MKLVLVLALLLVACSSKSASSSGPSAEEQAASDEGTSGLLVTQQMALVADSVFNFDPDLSPGGDGAANANAVEKRANASLGGCGSATLDPQALTVTVAFGPAPGCALTTGLTVSGTLVAAISRSDKLGIGVGL